MNELTQRARNAMTGLAIGDALSWTSMFHRSVLLPPWTRRIRREIDAASETTNVIAVPMPFSLNRPAHHFDLSPTDETEWAAFTADMLVTHGAGAYGEIVLREWMQLARSADQIRGGVATQAALQNLRNGLQPPQSGRENPHYFDDGAMARAVPIGVVCAGRPEKAAELAAIDACVTNSEDGVWAAQAMAAAVSLVCAGSPIDEAIAQARICLPERSWIKRTVDEALAIADGAESVFSLLPELHRSIVNREYSYGNVAPETLALVFVIARLHGRAFETAVTVSAAFAKSGEALPAMAGALSGAMNTRAIASESWLRAIGSLKGICIPSFAQKDYLTLTEQIAQEAGRRQ